MTEPLDAGCGRSSGEVLSYIWGVYRDPRILGCKRGENMPMVSVVGVPFQDGVGYFLTPLPNGPKYMAYKRGGDPNYLLNGMILQVPPHTRSSQAVSQLTDSIYIP